MYVDASAIVAIVGVETDRASLAARLETAKEVWVSGITVYESVLALIRKGQSVGRARELVAMFLRDGGARTVAIDAAISELAIEAFTTYGKGRHRAGLNMGDCFVYACARSLGVPLLFKGDDFGHTDIAIA